MTKRPITRADCANVPRPCPFVGCRHNMFLDVGRNGRGQGIAYLFATTDPTEMPADCSCSLDIVDERGPQTLEQIGQIWNITRERIRQIEAKGMRKLVRKRDAMTLWELFSDEQVDKAIRERFERTENKIRENCRRCRARKRQRDKGGQQ